MIITESFYEAVRDAIQARVVIDSCPITDELIVRARYKDGECREDRHHMLSFPTLDILFKCIVAKFKRTTPTLNLDYTGT